MKILSIDEDTRIIRLQCETCGCEFATTIGTYEVLKDSRICPNCFNSFEAGFIKKMGIEFEITGITPIPGRPFVSQQIQIRHLSPDCNYYTRTVSPHTLTICKGNPCTMCRKKDTGKDFKTRVKELTGNEYSVIGDYRGAKTIIKMRHNLCGHEWYVRPDNFIGTQNKAGSRCPKCQREKKTYEAKRMYARYHTS